MEVFPPSTYITHHNNMHLGGNNHHCLVLLIYKNLHLLFSHLPTHSITVYPMVTIRISDQQRLIQPYLHNYSWLLFASLTLYSADLASSEEVDGEPLDPQVVGHARVLQQECIQLIGNCLMKTQHGKGGHNNGSLNGHYAVLMPTRSMLSALSIHNIDSRMVLNVLDTPLAIRMNFSCTHSQFTWESLGAFQASWLVL